MFVLLLPTFIVSLHNSPNDELKNTKNLFFHFLFFFTRLLKHFHNFTFLTSSPPPSSHCVDLVCVSVNCKYLDYQSGNYHSEKSESVLAKTAPGFLDNLNAKLAEQRANNKAYAVRSYINSKVVVS